MENKMCIECLLDAIYTLYMHKDLKINPNRMPRTRKKIENESLFIRMPKQLVYPCSSHASFKSSQIETMTLDRSNLSRISEIISR